MIKQEDREDQDLKNVVWLLKRIGLIFVTFALLSSGIVFLCNRSVQVVDTGIVRYQEFQEMYNTCQSISTQICQIKAVDERDKMFDQFSKSQRVTGLQAQLTRWVNEYNAKSKLINFNVWKSNTLPYELSVNNFNCY